MGAKADAGKKYSANRSEEIWESFAKVIEICEEKEINLLLIAGDLFHRQPLLRELKEVDYLFSKLTKTKVVLIAGNHDYIRWNSYYRTFRWSKNVFPLFSDRLGCIEFQEIETAVYGFSYYQREITEKKYAKAKAWKKQKNEILLAHGGDEKHIPINRNELVSLGYNYIAFGHMHKQITIEENKIVYSGALEPIDKNDVGEHGYIEGEIKDGRVTTRFVPFAMREYVHMRLKIDDTVTNMQLKEMIKERIEKRGIKNIYKIILSGFRNTDIEFDHMRLKIDDTVTNMQLKEMIKERIEKRGIKNIYKIILSGFRNTDIEFDVLNTDPFGNILEIVDETKPAYRFEQLQGKNRDNLLGKYIESMGNCEPDSLEYMALYEGVEALLETKKG